ncbi:fluoride efflux transporter CrcB [Meridianimarinicoccus roseus]|uniref:Fluoride-specific ion channel FluC n=1 Tax=Meridianimarinicoccus roseus TaxID=2072018 RepID=A0A2V2LFJ4_9RHOB|nr:fluoride efflux transporter CrcB [Meridianimarinicoccus roseus]PWR02006.1 fluoride efflux transporter CrcB [Meridianimarinicoccus roseus]
MNGWTVAQVAAGGALGASARYAAGVAVMRAFGPGFPLGTLLCNVAGSFLMGLLVVTLAHFGGTRFAPFLAIGVLGGFTTFSSFSLDAVTLLERGATGQAAGYVFGSVLLSIGALFAGLAAARAVLA